MTDLAGPCLLEVSRTSRPSLHPVLSPVRQRPAEPAWVPVTRQRPAIERSRPGDATSSRVVPHPATAPALARFDTEATRAAVMRFIQAAMDPRERPVERTLRFRTLDDARAQLRGRGYADPDEALSRIVHGKPGGALDASVVVGNVESWFGGLPNSLTIILERSGEQLTPKKVLFSVLDTLQLPRPRPDGDGQA